MIKSHSITLVFHTEVIPLWSSQQSSSQSKMIKRRIVQFHHITIEVVSNFFNFLFFFGLPIPKHQHISTLMNQKQEQRIKPTKKKKHNFQLHTLRTKPTEKHNKSTKKKNKISRTYSRHATFPGSSVSVRMEV